MAQSANKLKAILFDKDGTLFDYAEVWEPILTEAIVDVFERIGKPHAHAAQTAMLKMLGVAKGNSLANGLLFTHRKSKIASRYLRFCIRWQINPITMMRSTKIGIVQSDDLIKARLQEIDFSMQQALFQRLKEDGWIVGIVTNDYQVSTDLFITHMGLEPYVDFIVNRESPYKRKPHPESFYAFCDRFGLHPQEVVMVGDTVTDLTYARRANAGYTIAVQTGGASERRLRRNSDVVYADISALSNDQKLFLPL